VLADVKQHALDPKCRLESRILERLVISWGGEMDYCGYLGEQKRLKSVVMGADPVVSLSFDIATSWVAVEEFSISFDTAEKMAEGSLRWPLLLAKGLVIIFHIMDALRSVDEPKPAGQRSTSPAEDAVNQRTIFFASPLRTGRFTL
jgi:hypothetical protein